MSTQPSPSLPLDDAACYAALRTHDARFDGRFFVGVSSTGIYCRPVCRVRTPKAENCTFYASAAAAEAAGYRPCLKCRPELAPGLSPADASSRTARMAARLIQSGHLPDSSLGDVAVTLGITDRHLRRVFAAEYGVPPVEYLQTSRLLLAKGLLTDTALPVTEVAMAAGFGSIRRFNALFKARYRLSPAALRKQGQEGHGPSDGVTLLLGYRPPYAWDSLLAFLSMRCIPGVESAEGGVYRRALRIVQSGRTHTGWLCVAHVPQKHALAVTLPPSLLPVLPDVLARVRHLFDLDCCPEDIRTHLDAPKNGLPGTLLPGLRVPGCMDAFEMAVRAILGQQVTVKAARTLAMRMAQAFGKAIATPFEGIGRLFPAAGDICALDGRIEDHLGPLGITGARARSIRALAGAMLDGSVTLTPHADPETVMHALLALPGFGPWTAQYVAMRALGWPDAFPHTDLGVKKALTGHSPAEILDMSQAWRPWRAYATLHLWNTLSEG